MIIDLNTEYSEADVAKLLASSDDSQDRQIRVTKEGIAYISDDVGSSNIDGLAFRLETFNQGNGYTGLKASEDADWVSRIYRVLRENWPEPSSTYIDSY
ncbi:hypothetical protein ACLBXM_19990 [Xanthobacteraceae bacterium A53D]